jgi:hypothetical protein
VTAPGRSNEPRMPPIRASADGGGNTDPAGPMTRAAAPAARRPRPSPACFFCLSFKLSQPAERSDPQTGARRAGETMPRGRRMGGLRSQAVGTR